MENEPQPKITIDELARMVQGGFAEMREKIETSVGSFRSETKAEFAAVNKRIDNLSYKLDQLDAKVEAHRQETKDGFAAFHPIIGSLSHTVVDHEERLKVLKAEMCEYHPRGQAATQSTIVFRLRAAMKRC